MNRSRWLLAGLILIALPIVLLRLPASGADGSWTGEAGGDFIPESMSIEDMLQFTNEVFVGVTNAYSGTETVVIPTDPTIDPNDPDGFTVPTIDVANYGVHVIEVLESAQGMEADQSVALQFISREPEEPQLSGAPLPGVRYLFFGTWLDDELAYVIPESERGLIVADEPEGAVMYSYGAEVPFAVDMTFAEFEQAVRDAIAAQN
jgi:hypothetical protein